MTMEQVHQRIKDAWARDLARSKTIPEDVAKIFVGWVRNRTNEAIANSSAFGNGTAVGGDGGESASNGGDGGAEPAQAEQQQA